METQQIVRQERILGTGDFVETVLSESGESAEQDFTSVLRNSGAIDKGDRNVMGESGAVIRSFHVRHF